MWALLLKLLPTVLGWFGIGKPDPVAQGERLGKAETTASDAMGELHDIQAASTARDAVSDDAAAVMRDSANAGPAK